MPDSNWTYPESYKIEQREWRKAIHLLAKIEAIAEHRLLQHADSRILIAQEIKRFKDDLTSGRLEIFEIEQSCVETDLKRELGRLLESADGVDTYSSAA